MPRLPTQPESTAPIPLRSGFYALPFNVGSYHLFTRLHSSISDDEQTTTTTGGGGTSQLYVTGIPLGMTEKGIKQTLLKVWDNSKIKQVEILPSSTSTGSSGVLSLYTKEVMAAQHGVPYQGITISPLFDPTSLPPPLPTSSSSAIITFTSPPTFPPPPYPSTTTLSIASQPSFLVSSSIRYQTARPHRSIALAHIDTWMQTYDQRKLSSAPASYSADLLIASREAEALAKKSKKGGKKGKLATDVGPLPGSAAEALARHAEEQRRKMDRDHNPDEVQDGEWTLVTGGGKHGKSLLPEGAVPNVEGYGGVTVKVATKKRGKQSEADEELNKDAGIKKIVGEGFYRFNKADSRRKSKFTFS